MFASVCTGNDGICSLLDQFSMFLLPFVVSGGSTHEFVDDGVRVAIDLLINVRELESGVGVFQSIEGRVHASNPSVYIPRIEWGKVRLANLLLTCLSCFNCSCNDGCIVLSPVSSGVV